MTKENNEKKDFLNLLDVKKSKSNSSNSLTIQEAVELNKDKYFEEDRVKKPTVIFDFSKNLNKKLQVSGIFTLENSKGKFIRIPHDMDKEFEDFLGSDRYSKAIVFLAYLGMQYLKEKGENCRATYNEI